MATDGISAPSLTEIDKITVEKSVAGAVESKLLQAIRYSRGKLELLDQRKLPHESIYIDIPDAEAGWYAIQDMVVRGAPAIAIAAALALAVEVVNRAPFGTPGEARDHIQERLDYLVSSRPTAVNLGIAAEQLKKAVEEAARTEAEAEGVVWAYVHAAEAMLADDVAANQAIGTFGAAAILEAVREKKQKEHALRVLTHCNTGSLATAAYGTALGVIRTLYADGKLEGAVCTETRPYNQGSRLTAFELVHDGIPATLIADSAAASLKALEKVDAVVVGADRIAANGDTANKIGTYALALSAFHHNIPFFVAAPLTSIDPTIASGAEIVIEERSSKELTHSLGGSGPQVAPTGIKVWNPAFDVTPAGLITGIITDKGVIKKIGTATELDIPAFLRSVTPSEVHANGTVTATKERSSPVLPVPFHLTANGSTEQTTSQPKLPSKEELRARGFEPLTESNVAAYLAGKPELASRLGGSSAEWKVREVGDGNLNFVYIVEGPSGSLVLKQALPYVRCVGESWPMTLERAYFEVSVLREHGRLAPEHTPEVYAFDHPMALIAMQYLAPPHIILRKGLIAGITYPRLAEDISTYLAHTLFHTSLLALSTAVHKANVAKYSGNVEMCRLTEQVIFTEPYQVAANNRWTTPQLDADAAAIREDPRLKLAVAALKAKFCERAQALLHGDLHTGSLLATPERTVVIDPEFGFYGPMGFDIGAFLANLVLAYFSQRGHASQPGARDTYKSWILRTIVDTWQLFSRKICALWEAHAEHPGDAYPAAVYNSAEMRRAAQEAFLKDLYEDSLGFAAAKIIRRIVGIAHVEDLESIADPDVRAACERAALSFAKRALKDRLTDYPTIEAVVADLRSLAP